MSQDKCYFLRVGIMLFFIDTSYILSSFEQHLHLKALEGYGKILLERRTELHWEFREIKAEIVKQRFDYRGVIWSLKFIDSYHFRLISYFECFSRYLAKKKDILQFYNKLQCSYYSDKGNQCFIKVLLQHISVLVKDKQTVFGFMKRILWNHLQHSNRGTMKMSLGKFILCFKFSATKCPSVNT